MSGPKTGRADRETVIREKEAQAKSALSEVVHEVESMEEGDCDTKLLKAVDGAVQSAERRAAEAKQGTGRAALK